MLTAGPVFVVTLPDDTNWNLEAVSPVDVTGNRSGREFVFVDKAQDRPPRPEEEELIRSIETPDARDMEVYSRLEEPPEWTLRWQLEGGAMYTHLREEDAAEHADIVAQSVEIVENELGRPPTLILEPPLKRMVSNQPGYHEYVLLSDPATDTWVSIRRPSTLKPDQVRTVPRFQDDVRPVLFRGAANGLEILVSSSTKSLDETSELARSLQIGA